MSANRLIHESSPYLLQHANNPVQWWPWNDEALEEARKTNKMILVSIGYSACHWCHVMEHESFEDEATARLMNENYICIKVDREERPDIDQVYMLAVQLMTGQGGWPLNCICLPDGKPIYGGTYFPRHKWQEILIYIAELYKNEPDRCWQYAEELVVGVNSVEAKFQNTANTSANWEEVRVMVEKWRPAFDNEEGGPNKAPKFPLPNNYEFLLNYALQENDTATLAHIRLTLDRMLQGGIYDQLGGGFARYSTDRYWKAPHFEKMLYDNAQLISLYSQASLVFDEPEYLEIAEECATFLERELQAPEGGLFSALDADSEGVEGKYYVWEPEELKNLLEGDFHAFSSFYDLGKGEWEEGIILLRSKTYMEVASALNISESQLREKVLKWKTLLLSKREIRVRPGLDDKQLCSWNALAVSAYCSLYKASNERKYIEKAISLANFVLTKLRKTDGSLYHTHKNGKSTINAFLEDYCFTIAALIDLFTISSDTRYIEDAENLLAYCLKHFVNKEQELFYFTSDEDAALISRKMEINDNVIPASNSVMAKNLFLLGHLLGNGAYLVHVERLLKLLREKMPEYPSGYSNWGILLQWNTKPFHEITITGPDAEVLSRELWKYALPNTFINYTVQKTDLAVFRDRVQEGQTLIYVCKDQSCYAPVTSVKEVLDLLKIED